MIIFELGVYTALSFQSSKDLERIDSLVSMIDKWSSVYSVLVGLVGVAQVLLLKSFFNIRPATSKLKMQT